MLMGGVDAATHKAVTLPFPFPGRGQTRRANGTRRRCACRSSSREMASLLRASAYGGSAFRRALLGREGLASHGAFPFRRLSSSGAGQTPSSSSQETRDEKVFKIDQLQVQVDELNHLIEKDIVELIEVYKEYQQCDQLYIERLLTRCGVPKTRSRDQMIWRSQLAIMTVLSAGVGYVLGGSV